MNITTGLLDSPAARALGDPGAHRAGAPSEQPERPEPARSARTKIMGVVNVTPDSFSDGGSYEAATAIERTENALAAARAMIADGADLVDVGGESTRPGAHRVPQREESARAVPVVAALVADGITVSVDTMYARTAEACLDLGDVIVNDVSGGKADPAMLGVVAERDAEFLLSHWRGHSTVMNSLARYDDAADEIYDELMAMRDRAVAAGIAPERIILDPGLGFAKDADDNWAVLRSIDRFVAAGHPLLIGASRKRFMGRVVGPDAAMVERDLPTAVVSALAALHGVWGVRVHNVRDTRIAIDVARAWMLGHECRRDARSPDSER